MLDGKFLYAAGYYPLMHEREDWDRDLKLMKESGINLVRTAELFNTWDRIEPKKGEFQFGFLDDFFDLCSKHGIQILLGTGTASPPYWLHEMYEDVNIVNNHNEQYPNNVSYSWACIDHEGYIEEVKRYVSILVNRYKDHDALYAYQIHNEISFPFMPLKKDDVDIYCYCDYSIKKFKKWVENKYVTLDKLNHAYRWGATNICHTSFEQVQPPKTKSTSWSSVTRWLDWRLFWMENIVEFVSMQNQLIKSLDTKHVTSTNIFFLKSQDPLGVITGLDQFEMAKVVDIIGYDLYPGSGDKLESKPEFSSMFLDMSRSTAESIGKKYWMMETEGGPINGWVLGPSRNVKGFDLVRNVYEAIGHDAKMSLYQGWREWEFQPLHWGAVVDLKGNRTERTDAVGKMGQWLEDESNLYYKSKTPKSKIAILMSKENAIVLNGMGQEEFLVKALRGAYRVFWEMNFKVDFVTPEIVAKDVSQYDMIYMPFMAVVNKELAQNLAKYVEAGGRLLGTARCGMLGEHGWYNYEIPCFSLQDVFGVNATEVCANTNPNITFNMRNYKGFWHREVLACNHGQIEILARFNDDQPAVTLNNYGQGKAIYFATHPDVGYLEEDSKLLRDVVEQLMARDQIKPYIELEYSNRQVKEVDAHLLNNDKTSLLIMTNYVNQSHSSFFNNGIRKVRVRANINRDYNQAIDLVNGETIPIKGHKGELYLEATVKKQETLILHLMKL